ncbi:dephospho-CoA kinase [Paractinoplanes durhamensis]|uniref:dephospho-CoA kinase n=1 Tax=Paractinoplanes durhamensis TaxID=113563 RepID=UPI003638F562
MLRVGLTGGIGAGKSAVAKRLVAQGAVLIDSDVLAREVVAVGTPGLAAIVEAFGAGILTAGGELDRPALGAKVFGDDEARHRLEKIIHPRVRDRAVELTRAAAPDAIVVNDVPLLVETGQAPSYHLVLVVDAERDLRIRRLEETRGMTADQAAARIAAQADDGQRRAAADVLLANNGTLDELHAQVDVLVRDRLRPFEEHLRLGTAARVGPELRIVDPDPTWPEQAARLIARIRYATGDGAAVAHIGSTAVPGLPAKDIIDLMLAVRTLDEADALAERLGRAGFPRQPGSGGTTRAACPARPGRSGCTAPPTPAGRSTCTFA